MAGSYSSLAVLLGLARLLAGQYTGAQACGVCHPAQFKTQSASAHARALSRAEPEWAFGAGVQAITYVSQVDPETYVEHGLSYYASTKAKALTPGHRDANGVRYRTFDPGAQILRCFRCHSTGNLALGEVQRIVPAEMGVRCESCHGPGADHSKILNPRKSLNAAGLNDLCGNCHRMPPAAGEDTDWTNAWNVRHQPVYLSQSECFRRSEGRLSCLTCHDPHGAQPVKASCQECHAKPRHRAAVAGTCIGCHMPKVRPQANLAFANHWIGVYVAGNPLRPRER